MFFWEIVLWTSFFIIFYNYAGYAVIALILNKLKQRRNLLPPQDYYPSISFIVAAYNEEDCIEKKIVNSLQQNYPKDKIEFIFITDGSTDSTTEIIKTYPSVRLLHLLERNGKTAALNRAVANARNEIMIFSDANTILNKEASFNIAKHYYDRSVGGVAGEKKVIILGDEQENAANSEGLYWKYESLLKRIDSTFHSVVGAAGELFSVRRELYEPVAPEVILDDFIISMKIAQNGYRIIYEPAAYAMELPSFSIKDERKRKVRIAAGGFQSIAMLPKALFFWKHWKLSYLYISHRVLRWTLSPICLGLAFLSNLILVFFNSTPFYVLLFILQLSFYFSALGYQISPGVRKKVSVLKLPYYFVFMNVSVFRGFFKFLQKKQSSAWEKAKRISYHFPEMKN